MSGQFSGEPMLDMYIFETNQNIEQLEKCILDSERSSCYTQAAINEIFRIMHTIKGSSAMMLFSNISVLAHSIEDLFYFLREQKPDNIDCSALSDYILAGIDFIKLELRKIEDGEKADGIPDNIIEDIKSFLRQIKSENPDNSSVQEDKRASAEQPRYYITPNKINKSIAANTFKAVIFFEDGCEMENIRAFTIIHNIREFTEEVFYFPEDIIDNDDSINVIREQGFKIYLKTRKSHKELSVFFNQTVFLRYLELEELKDDSEFYGLKDKTGSDNAGAGSAVIAHMDTVHRENQDREVAVNSGQSIISVNISKLDKLMDLVGEMVISEAMVTQNPDLGGLQLENFQKAARQLHKITSDIQDMVMSIRMVPLAITFQKMQRIVRDMGKKLEKEVELELIGEETEVDKNIIEHISDPLMHLVRNSIDHGIETKAVREALGKPSAGKITLEAKNSGSDVVILVKDDGKGLNKESILEKAGRNGLLTKPAEEMTDKEVYNLIFLPGFSTKEKVTEFSGRGVGMDVVVKNIESVGGSVAVDSWEGTGSVITLKIPLTLAIIDGMNVLVGNSRYTIPTKAIKESFRPGSKELIKDPDGNEMIMVRGNCYPVLRLHEFFRVKTQVTGFTEGILIMVEHENRTVCLFADELLGQQQVVVKALPQYIKARRKVKGLTGCTLLGDGSISLILDIGSLVSI
ncbi:chemotaxis protein CheA [Ruminiclostridium hungatei]|uniref:Chemotaxis protein CheA n=1 Tax=Ruminiclostridium hungatei TaxID=48256 RepID=A0A1V4SPV9_RUMHU|nr:chemotaxis protein CheA [Ruminiclostridium hungatei]OPX45505.1 chemotaxis protein CheA [Ruminiclostridium hungatei]